MLNFYDVDKQYIAFLKSAEIAERGYSCVPNMEYGARAQKFLCGIVLEINAQKYYVPVSSNKNRMPDSVYVQVPSDKKNPIKGTLKFNYMIPVPDMAISIRRIKEESDLGRRRFLNSQLKYCQSIEQVILNQAKRTYYKRINGLGSEKFMEHSCIFDLLEQKCKEYQLN